MVSDAAGAAGSSCWLLLLVAGGCSDSSEFMRQEQQATMQRTSRVSPDAPARLCHDVISFCGRHII